MSSPEIALHNKNVMEEKSKGTYVKRTQRDYTMSLNYKWLMR